MNEKVCWNCVFCEPLFINDDERKQDRLNKVCICHNLGDYVDIDSANSCNHYKEKQLQNIKVR